MTIDSHDAASTDEPTRRNLVLKMLRDSSEPRTIVDLAAELGVHANTVRFHLDSLATAGRVERIVGVKVGRGRPPTKYRAMPGMDPAGPTNYQLLATVLTSQFATSSPNPARDAQSLGQAWSETLFSLPARRANGARSPSRSRVGDIRRVTDKLDELGFAPERVEARSTEIRLRHCPFLDLVPANADVVCSLHLGLMQGAFQALNSSVTVAGLDAFVEPDLCVARLATTGAAGGGSRKVGSR